VLQRGRCHLQSTNKHGREKLQLGLLVQVQRQDYWYRQKVHDRIRGHARDRIAKVERIDIHTPERISDFLMLELHRTETYRICSGVSELSQAALIGWHWNTATRMLANVFAAMIPNTTQTMVRSAVDCTPRRIR
jgi:hypothetical protein